MTQHTVHCLERENNRVEKLHAQKAAELKNLEEQGVDTSGRGYGWTYNCTCQEDSA